MSEKIINELQAFLDKLKAEFAKLHAENKARRRRLRKQEKLTKCTVTWCWYNSDGWTKFRERAYF